jgi:radical SAM protein with 4Fe4S-binding SPASM domain
MNGADPLKREDIFLLVRLAAQKDLHPVLAVRATPLLTRDAVLRLKQAGLSRLALTLDGSTAELHDLICGVYGSYARTIEATQWADQARLPFQITTQLSERNLHDLEAIATMIKPFRVAQWNVAFPVPQESQQMEEMPSAREFEDTFARLYEISKKVPFKIRTIDAQHYRRYILQQHALARSNGSAEKARFEEGIPGILPFNEEHATIFIAHNGEVFPSASLRVSVGNVRIQTLGDIYHNSKILEALRDRSNLKGKCGMCGFGDVCGGSRGRAFNMNRDLFEEDPSCIYRPPQSQRVSTRSPRRMPPVKIAVEPQE